VIKRLFDALVALALLIVSGPVILLFVLLIWLQDRHNPFYIAVRSGRNGIPFRMVKLRSMTINADRTGVASTSSTDVRITRVGHLIRKYKLDEITQMWNVLKGDMSLVGPRPQLSRATQHYTDAEKILLTVRPGITDIASIVFSDEGEILKGHADPDLAYEQLIRPGKSMLGLFYIAHRSLLLDIRLCWLTAVAILSRERALSGIRYLLESLDAPQPLLELAARKVPLTPKPPPGAQTIITSRDGNPNVA
jgi:lipopolysaccharide/colanic/teichoic acid biosynthesis glycosyltransferase